MGIQLEFFRDAQAIEMENELKKIRESCERVRKKLFAENGKLKKEMMELKDRVDILESHICSGEIICHLRSA